MASNSVIGALRVDLGLNSAQFTTGLKNAQSALGKFGTIAARGFTAVAAAATVAAGALGIAVKGAVDHADELGKAAQKAGVTVEALSRLEYAAKLSDISLESLTGGLQKLSKGMTDAAGGKGPAAAFKALGIAVTDNQGALRDSGQVFGDIADRFSRMEDGATKTALAIQIFGRSGAEMIPLLNSGRDGLKAMADESDKLGATISTKTAKGAEKFNDTLTRIGQVMQGVVNKVMEAALPALQSLADKLASPEFAEAAQQLAIWVVNAVTTIVDVISQATTKLSQFGGEMVKWARVAADVASGNFAGAINNYQVATMQEQAERWKNRLSGGWGAGAFGKPAEITVNGGAPTAPIVIPPFNTSGATASLKPLDLGLDTTTGKIETLADKIGGPLSNAISGFASAILSGTSPLEAFADQLSNIGNQLLNAGIQGLVNAALGGISFGGPSSFAGSPFRFGGPSFDGGGYTGVGSRSGGMDGKGGFLAMLHPDETVLDHSKGQGGAGINVTIDARGAQAGVAEQIDRWARMQLPALIRKANADPHAVGG
jgi:hypothetical protein